MYRACCPTNKKKGGWCFCSAQCVVKRNKHAGQYRRKRNAPEKATLYCYGKFFAQSWTMKDLKILTGDSFSWGTPLECTAIRQVFWWCSWFTVDEEVTDGQSLNQEKSFQFPVILPRVWLKQTYPPHQLPQSLHQHLTIQPTNSQFCYKTMTFFQRTGKAWQAFQWRTLKQWHDALRCEIMRWQWLGCSRHLTCNSVLGKSHVLEHWLRGQSHL